VKGRVSVRRLKSATAASLGLWSAFVTGGCSATPRIQRVTAEPVGCAFLGSIWAYQVGNGPPGSATLSELMTEAESLGGNTLQCCEEGDVVVLRGGDALEHIGRVYNCPAHRGGLPPNTSLERTRER